jgi:hypothetical protein
MVARRVIHDLRRTVRLVLGHGFDRGSQLKGGPAEVGIGSFGNGGQAPCSRKSAVQSCRQAVAALTFRFALATVRATFDWID